MAQPFFETIYNIPGSAGAVTSIPCTIPCCYMEIIEVPDPAGTTFAPTGLVYNLRKEDGTYTSNAKLLPVELLPIGERAAAQGRGVRLIGINAQSGSGVSQDATNPVKLISNTVTQTWVRVREWAQ